MNGFGCSSFQIRLKSLAALTILCRQTTGTNRLVNLNMLIPQPTLAGSITAITLAKRMHKVSRCVGLCTGGGVI